MHGWGSMAGDSLRCTQTPREAPFMRLHNRDKIQLLKDTYIVSYHDVQSFGGLRHICVFFCSLFSIFLA